MINEHIICLILFSIGLVSTAIINTNIYAQPSQDIPKITEVKIPHVMNFTLENTTAANLMNISYVFEGKEYYFLFNLTHAKLQNIETADCVDRKSEAGEKNYICLPQNKSDFSVTTLLCNTNTNDCVQPSSRHK